MSQSAYTATALEDQSPTGSGAPKKRIYYLDYLRVISIFMVLLVHASEIFYLGPSMLEIKIDENNGFWVNLIDSAMRACVPLFVIASGYLLLPLKDSPETFYKRRFSRILFPFIIWSILYAVLPYLWGAIDLATMKTQLYTLTHSFNMPSGHLWFMYMFIGVYLFMPIISPWLKESSKKFMEFFLGIWFLTTFYHFAKLIFPNMLGEVYWNEFHTLWYFSGYIGYIVLAVYFRRFVNWSTSKNLIVGIPTFLIGYAVTYFVFKHQMGTAKDLYQLELSWRFCTPNVAMMTVGLFLIIKSIKIENQSINKVIKEISRLSFGIYLAHMFLLGPVYSYLIKGLELSTPVAIISTGTICFIATLALVKALSYLPKNKYLIG
ncbi:acyltransferase [Aureibacter tunicatorum]|uniref:Surface polysaccharide O-acyltransferase-like enzyme n=1 Tax=Aureibacter tunicatorum TaxID=866807 RepID=A0AAE3XQ32_9BACT|nr:acyltransferase [Aureibacter tunicatorum]MDR6240502.1 surface polysaccharide O-acyltransferase-like enzyme [Aureibacter tunicatorum]BDD06635.1 membrane protein [Aureibacter tunicatorum]